MQPELAGFANINLATAGSVVYEIKQMKK